MTVIRGYFERPLGVIQASSHQEYYEDRTRWHRRPWRDRSEQSSICEVEIGAHDRTNVFLLDLFELVKRFNGPFVLRNGFLLSSLLHDSGIIDIQQRDSDDTYIMKLRQVSLGICVLFALEHKVCGRHEPL